MRAAGDPRCVPFHPTSRSVLPQTSRESRISLECTRLALEPIHSCGIRSPLKRDDGSLSLTPRTYATVLCDESAGQTADHRRLGLGSRSEICLDAQLALKVQYAPAAAIPIQLMVGSSSAAR